MSNDKKEDDVKKVKVKEKVQSNIFDTREIINQKQANKEMAEAVQPKKSCKHCYGTGFIGTRVESGEKVRCKCTRRK